MLRFKSESDNIQLVEEFVLKLREAYGLSEDVFSSMLISLTEAVNNAITHGNKNDRSKFVCIKSCIDINNIVVRVEDEGNGFLPEYIPDPTLDENLSKVGGRGVMIMRHLADHVNYTNNGTCVELKFSFESIMHKID